MPKPKAKSSSPQKDRTLLAFAPLIYLAWSDGLLSEDEVERIRARIPGRVSPSVERILEQWLNPKAPPTPSQLYGLLEMMRAAGGKTRRKFASLSELGRFLGKRGAPPASSQDETTPELLALKEIEEALGVAGQDAISKIVGAMRGKGHVVGRIDTETLCYGIDGERHDVHRYIFNMLQRPVFERADTQDMAAYRAQVLAWCQELARLGVTAYGFPRAYGGEGNIPKSIAVFETLAFHDLSLMVKYGVQFGLFGGSILQLGTKKHHEAYLRAVASLELPGCFAMTETGHGSNVRDIQTTASYDKATQSFVIDTPAAEARKDYIGNAALHARMATVFAQLEVNGREHGVHAFLVPIRDQHGNVLPGIEIEDNGRKIGLNGVDNGRIAFSGVRVPLDNLLDRFGSVTPDGEYHSTITSASRRFFTMLSTLVAGRISIAAGSNSASKLGLAIATRYASRRVQFGPEDGREVPILSYRSIQHQLLPLIARTYALDFAVHDSIRLFNAQEQDTRELELRAAALKAAASRHAVDALQYARELCGGQGYMWENRIGELRADTDVFTTFEGANNVLEQLVAKGLLTELKEQFEEMRVRTVVREITSRAGTAVTELNPVITRKTDEDHLRDPEFHGNALRYREARLLRSVAARLRHHAERLDAFAAVNEVQEHMMKLAVAYTERLAWEAFQRRVERIHEPVTRDALNELCTLFALSCIEQDRAWFLESGYVEGSKAKAIRALVVSLSVELHEQAVAFTDAWGIPERYYAPIARKS